MTAADIIVASVQANPPGGDVAVSPAVRVLVEEIVRLQGELANGVAAHPLTVDVTTGMARFITQEDIHRFDVNYERIRAELEHLRHLGRVCDSECGPIQAIAHAWYRAEEEFYLPDEDPYAAIVRLREELEIARADIKE